MTSGEWTWAWPWLFTSWIDFDCDSIFRLLVSIGDCIVTFVTEVNMITSCWTLVSVPACSRLFTPVAWVVHWTHIRDYNHNAGSRWLTRDWVSASNSESPAAWTCWIWASINKTSWTPRRTVANVAAALTLSCFSTVGVICAAAAFWTCPEVGSIGWSATIFAFFKLWTVHRFAAPWVIFRTTSRSSSLGNVVMCRCAAVPKSDGKKYLRDGKIYQFHNFYKY